jgi:hypothetical protein
MSAIRPGKRSEPMSPTLITNSLQTFLTNFGGFRNRIAAAE